MKKLNQLYWVAGLLALTAHDVALARSGRGYEHHVHERHGQRHGHFNLGIAMGGFNHGFYGSAFYPYGHYVYPGSFFVPPRYGFLSIVTAPVKPTVYIQREQTAAAHSQANYWYYCRNPEGYYPSIKNCREDWIKVAPQSSTP